MGSDPELITVGRISVDLYSSQPGADWYQTPSFVKAVGGSPTNVAVAAARLGHPAAVFTKVGADPFGDYLTRRLGELGVDTRYVGTHPKWKTPLAFAVTEHPDSPELLMYRDPIAPDLTIEASDIDAAVACRVPVLWISGTAVSAEPSAGTVMELLRARSRAKHVIVDLDYRSFLWGSPAEASRAIGALVEYATVAVGNLSECEIATGSADPEVAADRLLGAGVELACVKLGSKGVLVATPELREVVDPHRIDVVCGLGAGDAFGGGLVHGLLRGWDPVTCVRFANAAGALVASRLLCSDAMGTEGEISDLLKEKTHGPV